MHKAFNFSAQLSIMAVLCLAAASATAQVQMQMQGQSRTCIIDEVNGQHRCGYLADEQGFRIADRPVYVPAPTPAAAAPVFPSSPLVQGRPGSRTSYEERAAFEQQRMEVQELVNKLFLEVLGRDADIVTLRRVAGQVMEGRALADVRIELATSSEARAAINQIYRDILRREADPSGLNAQLAGLRSGQTLEKIRQAIAQSSEAKNKR